MHFALFAKVQNWLVKKLITIKFSFFTTLHGRFSSSSSLSFSPISACMLRRPYHWRKNGTADVEPGTELHISAGRIHTWGGEESSIGIPRITWANVFSIWKQQAGTEHVTPLRRKAKTASECVVGTCDAGGIRFHLAGNISFRNTMLTYYSYHNVNPYLLFFTRAREKKSGNFPWNQSRTCADAQKSFVVSRS